MKRCILSVFVAKEVFVIWNRDSLYFERDAEETLVHWLEEEHTVMEMQGARQVGKTTLLKHFGSLYFKNVIYISFAEDTGRVLMQCIRKCQNFIAGCPAGGFYVGIFISFAKRTGCIFTNDENTLVIIDEIQESKEVYEMIKPFYEYLSCRVIVTGSYLFKASQYFQPVGCISQVTLYPLSFMEFIQIFGKRSSLEREFKDEQIKNYDAWYGKAYEVYCSVGGYPDVILSYLKYQKIDVIRKKQKEIINVLVSELSSRLEDFADNYLIKDIMGCVSDYMVTEKRGGKLITGLISKLIENYEKLSFTKKEVYKAIAVLLEVGVISSCDKYNFDKRDIMVNERIYFNDMGLLSYYLENGNYDKSQTRGIVAENFIFKTLNEPCRYHQLAGIRPQFGITGNGELDFTVINLNRIRYGIEVKSGTNAAKTGHSLFKDGKIDYLVTFKGITNENAVEEKITLPIFLGPLYAYDAGIPEKLPDLTVF